MQFLALPTWEEIFRGLMALLCQVVYPIVGWLYDLFINVSKVNILSSNEVQPIYQRVTMILTIVMVFYVTFQFVKYIVQPDTISDKEQGMGNIIYKMIAVVVLIAFVPTIFTAALKLQTAIIDKGVIGKVILGPTGSADSNFGPAFSSQIFSMFYRVDSKYANEDCDGIPCGALVGMNIKSLRESGHLGYLTTGLNASVTEKRTEDGKEYEITTSYISFDGLLAVIVGGFIGYILALYCVDVGIRWAQLVFLQVIAPIPIIGYLSPKKDGIFQKWIRQCTTTYLDLFIRTAIIYFVLLICNILLESRALNGGLLDGLGQLHWLMETFVYIVLILGVLMFAKKAPKLLQELFPSTGAASGNFSLNPKERGMAGLVRTAGGVAGGVIGAAAGAATGIAQGWRRSKALDKDGNEKGTASGVWGATKGAMRGAFGGAARGVYNGAKKGNVFKNSIEGAKNQIESNKKFGNREEGGYSLGDQIGDRFRGAFGAPSRTEAQEQQKAPIKRHDDALKRVTDTEASIKKRALEKVKEGAASGSDAAPELQNAARKLAATEARLKTLEDPNASANEFKVGKYKATESNKAQKDYDDAVVLAKSSVNKANFTDSSGTFDQAGYDRAVAAAASQVKAEDYAVAYKTEEEAQAAYTDARRAARASISRSDYSDQASFEAACRDAENSINKDLFIKGYTSEADAEAAKATAIDNARAQLDADQKEVVAQYAKHSGDAAVRTMAQELATYVEEYNATAAMGNADGTGSRRIYAVDNAGRRTEETLSADSILQDFKGFSAGVKKGAYRDAIDENAQRVISIDAEIDRIKRQTEGSGIGGDKK